MDSSSAHTKSESFLHSYIRGEAAFGFWGLVSRGLAGVNALIIISQLDVYRYGLYILLFAFYYLVAGFMLRPLSEVIFNDIIRFEAEGKKAEAKKLYLENIFVRFISAILAFLIVFFGANFIALFYEKDMAILFRILSSMFLIDVFTTSMRTLLQVNLRFSTLILRQVLHRFLKLIFILLFLFLFSFGTREALIAHVIASFLSALLFVPYFIKLSRPWLSVKTAKKSILFQIIKAHGKWALFSQTVATGINNIRPWLIKIFINTEAVAIYSVAESIFGVIKTLIPQTTLKMLIPREIKDRARRSSLLLRGIKYLFVISILLGLVSAIIVPPMISWLLPQYISSVPLFLILLVSLPILSFSSLSVKFIVALRRQKFLFLTQFLKIILGIVFPITLLYFFGIFGMAYQRILMAIIVGALYFGYLVRNEIDVQDWKALITFTAEDKKLIQKIWRILITSLRSKLKKYTISSNG